MSWYVPRPNTVPTSFHLNPTATLMGKCYHHLCSIDQKLCPMFSKNYLPVLPHPVQTDLLALSRCIFLFSPLVLSTIFLIPMFSQSPFLPENP